MSKENQSSTRKNVSNVENVSLYVLMMPLQKKNVLVQEPVVSMPLKAMRWEEQKSTMINAYPAECVW